MSRTLALHPGSVDQRDHVAFVLTHGTERIVGEARHAVSGDEAAAELVIVVTDAFRGLVVGFM